MEKVETTADKPIGLRSILIVLCSTLGTASYAFTWNSVGVALPHMQGSFSATSVQIAWVNLLSRQLFSGVQIDYTNGTLVFAWQHGGVSEVPFVAPDVMKQQKGFTVPEGTKRGRRRSK